jgi:hypothetical protein
MAAAADAAARKFLKIRLRLFFKNFGVLYSNSFECDLVSVDSLVRVLPASSAGRPEGRGFKP